MTKDITTEATTEVAQPDLAAKIQHLEAELSAIKAAQASPPATDLATQICQQIETLNPETHYLAQLRRTRDVHAEIDKQLWQGEMDLPTPKNGERQFFAWLNGQKGMHRIVAAINEQAAADKFKKYFGILHFTDPERYIVVEDYDPSQHDALIPRRVRCLLGISVVEDQPAPVEHKKVYR